MKYISILILISLSVLGCNNSDKKTNKNKDFNSKFEQMDENKDKKISLQEAKGPLYKHFNIIDSNNDGFLSKEELRKKRKKRS